MSDESGVLTPPWYWRLAYRLLFRRLPQEYGPWIAEDLIRPGWALRITLTKYLNTLLLVGVGALVWRAAYGTWTLWFLLHGGLLLGMIPFEWFRSVRRPVTARREILDHQQIDQQGNPVPGNGGWLAAIRTRLLPRRDNEAVAYLVVVLLALNATAAIGLSRRPDKGPFQELEGKKCVKVNDAQRKAVADTLKPGVTIISVAAHKYSDDGIALIAKVSGAPKAATAVWLVRAEGRGYRVNLSSFVPDTGSVSTAPKIEVGTSGKLYMASALAFSCLTGGAGPK